jgi:3-dehydroquinate synthase
MRIAVPHSGGTYDVVIEDGLIDRSAPELAPLARDGRLIVISDELVWALHGSRLETALGSTSLQSVLVAPGEGSKSWEGLARLCERLIALGVERGDHIIAFGGGVVGDLAGFAAAILNRGCNFVQVPTTLLAQVDSSVGGKTGINAAAGKNLVGAFHQPSLVLVDPALLETLDRRQVRAGYAEIVKYGLIDDPAFFGWLEIEGRAVLEGEPAARHRGIATSIASKARIVAEDERERSGRRALLNLGHTFGHAVESLAGFDGRLLHGEAVALGTVLAFDYSVEQGLCAPEDAERVRAHLSAAGLPVSLRETGLEASGALLMEHMLRDKKVEGGRLTLILTRGIGRAFVQKDADCDSVTRFLNRRSSG